VARFAARVGVRIESVSQATMDRLNTYSWPGNIRELENILERAIILANGPSLEIDPEVFGTPARDAAVPSAPPSEGDGNLAALESTERVHITAALKQANGVIDGPRGAARILGLHPNTLRSRMKKLGIKRTSHEPS